MSHDLPELERQFHQIARQLTQFDLQKLGSSDDKAISMDEIVADLQQHSGSSLFMGYYTRAGLMEVFERYGIKRLLEEKGFSDLHLVLQTDVPFRHGLQLYWESGKDPDRLLIEIILHEGVVTPKGDRTGALYDMVFIEWLCLQNPSAEFQPSRSRLPGQQKPGLGISMEIAELLAIMAERLGKDGLINIPRYYHTAYGARRIGFLFFDPETEGIMRALGHNLGERPLSEASWAVELGLVHHAGTSEPLLWTGEEQVLAISERMKEFFASEDYILACSGAERSTKFSVNWKNHNHMPNDIEEDGRAP